MNKRIASVAAIASALALAACGNHVSIDQTTTTTTPGSTTGSGTATTAAGGTSSTGSTAPTASSSSSSASSSTSAPSSTTSGAGGRCRAGDLTAALGGSNGTAGAVYYTITVTNRSGAPCTTGGYFGVSTYSVAGQAISTQDVRDLPSQVQQFTMLAGGSLSFMAGLSQVPAGQGSCPRVGAFHLIPPNDTQYLQLSLLDSSGQGPQVIDCQGSIGVTPLVSAGQ